MSQSTVVILGAGASRAVSYAQDQGILSPLDADFFEQLQKLEPNAKDEPAVSELIQQILNGGAPAWESMERAFYTLHVRARMSEVLFPEQKIEATTPELLSRFTRSINALLRAAHGIRACDHHVNLLDKLNHSDAIVTFNYDLVAERALRSANSNCSFGGWIYGFQLRPPTIEKIPTIYKLHGSVNWTFEPGTDGFRARQTSWEDFDREPGYRASGADSVFPIMLPFWDKKVEEKPWSDIWKQAAQRLKRCSRLIVWGYSLPQTDLKALELVRLSLDSGCLEEISVVDPDAKVRTRWRAMFPRQRYWPFRDIYEFLTHPPNWW